MKLKIGISFTYTKYPNYPAWIEADGRDLEIIELSFEKNNIDDLLQCHGLLLSGGIDIDPFYYAKEKIAYPLMPNEWSKKRDAFEIALLHKAIAIGMPVLGICRGLQLVNIALEGTLIQDIETEGKPNHRAMNGIDHVHKVAIIENSLLASIAGIKNGQVNSAHHQAIEKVADTLMVNAFSTDDIIEGVEWRTKEGKSPLLCTQWHPERMDTHDPSPLSGNIRNWFLNETEKFAQ